MKALHFLVDTVQSYQFRLFWPELMMMLQLPRRQGYWLRMLVWLPFLFVPVSFGNQFSSAFFIIGNYNWSFLAWFAYSLFALAFCHRMDLEQLVFIGVASYSIQNLFANIKYFLFYRLGAPQSMVFAAAMLALMTAVYGLFYFYFVRSWGQKMRLELKINKRHLLILATAVMLLQNVLSSYLHITSMSAMEMAHNCLLFAVCSVLVVLLLAVIYDRSYNQYEQDTLRQLLSEQEKQRSLSQRTISMINMKCHDMKHQLLSLGQAGTEENLFAKEALSYIRIFDSFFKTGNEYLDLVLTEKSLLCQSEKIVLTCSADGAALGFMSPTDIYSFFGNALDNAIECQQSCPEHLRSISVSVCRQNSGFVSIVIKNFSQSRPEFRNGIPKTSKLDENYHGFGTKSMRYIIQDLYGGNLLMRQEGDAFIVSALLLADAKRKE